MGDEVIRALRSESPRAVAQPPEGGGTTTERAGLATLLGSWLGLLRRYRYVAVGAGVLTLTPFVLFGFFALPSYSSSGVVQVANEGNSAMPMLDFMGELGGSQVDTEVEILRRREAVVETFTSLGLHVIDPDRPWLVTKQWSVATGQVSPTPTWLDAMRGSIAFAQVTRARFEGLRVEVLPTDASTISIAIGDPGEASEHTLAVGDTLEAQGLTISFNTLPGEVGVPMRVYVETEGEMLDRLLPQLAVAPVGSRDRATDLVAVRFSHADRFVAQAVVDDLMRRYLQQSLDWQATGASKSAEFIRQRLEDADEELAVAEQKLREFSESEHAVQLDTQARVTIENVAVIEAELRQAAEARPSVLYASYRALRLAIVLSFPILMAAGKPRTMCQGREPFLEPGPSSEILRNLTRSVPKGCQNYTTSNIVVPVVGRSTPESASPPNERQTA